MCMRVCTCIHMRTHIPQAFCVTCINTLFDLLEHIHIYQWCSLGQKHEYTLDWCKFSQSKQKHMNLHSHKNMHKKPFTPHKHAHPSNLLIHMHPCISGGGRALGRQVQDRCFARDFGGIYARIQTHTAVYWEDSGVAIWYFASVCAPWSKCLVVKVLSALSFD